MRGCALHHVPGSLPAALAASMAAGGSFTEGKAYLVGRTIVNRKSALSTRGRDGKRHGAVEAGA